MPFHIASVSYHIVVTELDLVKIPGSGRLCLWHVMFRLDHSWHLPASVLLGLVESSLGLDCSVVWVCSKTCSKFVSYFLASLPEISALGVADMGLATAPRILLLMKAIILKDVDWGITVTYLCHCIWELGDSRSRGGGKFQGEWGKKRERDPKEHSRGRKQEVSPVWVLAGSVPVFFPLLTPLSPALSLVFGT